MELVSLGDDLGVKGAAELPGQMLTTEGEGPRLFDAERLRQIKDYARCGRELPTGLFTTLAVLDAGCGLSAHHFLFELKDHCNQWAGLEKGLLKAMKSLTGFGTDFSKFCSETSGRIRALPILCQAAKQAEGNKWRARAKDAVAALRRQVGARERESGQLLRNMDRFREVMDNTIVPQSDTIRKALGALGPLELDTPWFRVTVEHCGFLADNPVVRGFVRDLRAAGTEEEAGRIRTSLELTARPIWERMLGAFSQLDETGVAVADAAVGVRNLDTLWTAVTIYLDGIGCELEHAEEAQRLLLLANGLDACAASWTSLADYGRQLRDALEQAE